MDKRVAVFLQGAPRWNEEMTLLRKIVMSCDLSEDFKWNHPCYTHDGKNIVLIHGFKAYCALLFHKGALLKDPEQLLVQQTKNSQIARQLRFQHTKAINKQQEIIKAYIKEAIRNERQGKSVPLKTTSEYEVPNELLQKFEADPEYKKAFDQLTPGRQRGYLLYFGAAKQANTRHARIEKATAKIEEGKGYNER
ncbi:YdeI/OmpD-associated family protein [Altibacter sp. HG106]|uniref:YdeI/OmpD-associated family protein n=1 Tax=Altibacter sp. HG106 TaxID=3023937 RepID=UPI0023509A4D|nr:DUF1801 domain-containing protein [Altibacter sp. HG106]MDC7995658.1 YdeI/OmpD-associated family protein [Altibacter sp. HG106]